MMQFLVAAAALYWGLILIGTAIYAAVTMAPHAVLGLLLAGTAWGLGRRAHRIPSQERSHDPR